MRWFLTVFALGSVFAQPPTQVRPSTPAAAGNPLWRRNLLGAIGQQPGRATVRDIQQIEQYMLSAAPYCTSLTPGDYEANRDLARQMTAYLMMVNSMATDPQTRAAALRASRAVAAFPCAFPQPQQAKPQAAAPAPPSIGEPPFEQKAPQLDGVADADKDTANDLRMRYESDAAKAAVVWRNAETMRQSLAARGMSLNADTAASMSRLQLFLEEAATSLRDHKWDEALSSLQAVEATAQKAGKAVGQ
ncbi:MAG TPA: hypothetical protein VKX49_17035 [Bryobacteraceae bacterium]|nr:hypothetical protein [Bryobacteraceae bacterium]